MEPARRRRPLIAVAALVSVVILAGDRAALAQGGPPAPAGDAVPAPVVLVQAQPPPVRERIGLPPVRNYEPTPELRDIYFDFGKAVIRPADVETLDANAVWLRAHPEYLLLIEGHCDNRGPADRKNEFNMALGERRAEAAMKYLVARGVDPSRITILSYGEERPVCARDDERCWQQNRSARFLVRPR